jgi:hypothetical protein
MIAYLLARAMNTPTSLRRRSAIESRIAVIKDFRIERSENMAGVGA